jgi:hypothetical protein
MVGGMMADSTVKGAELPSLMLGGCILCGLLGGLFGLFLRSYRAWLFVLTCALLLGVLVAAGMFVSVGPRPAQARQGPLMGLLVGLAFGTLAGWALALPIKLLLWLGRLLHGR